MPRIQATQTGSGTFVPLLPIEIAVPGRKPFGYMAIVDSGADFSIAPAEILEAEGIVWGDLAPHPKSGGTGAGGTFGLRRCEGTLSWRGKTFATQFAVAEPGKLPVSLLGRDDFFRAFRVQLRWYMKPPEFDILEP